MEKNRQITSSSVDVSVLLPCFLKKISTLETTMLQKMKQITQIDKHMSDLYDWKEQLVSDPISKFAKNIKAQYHALSQAKYHQS